MSGGTVVVTGLNPGSGQINIDGQVYNADAAGNFTLPATVAAALFGLGLVREVTAAPSDDLPTEAQGVTPGKMIFDTIAGRPLWWKNATVGWVTADGSIADRSRPTVVSVAPTDGATGVSVTPSIVVTFSEPMDPVSVDAGASASIFLEPTDGAPVPDMAGSVAWSVGNTVCTIEVDTPLQNSKSYKIHVAADGFVCRDVQGNPLLAEYVQATAFVTVA